MRYAEHPSIVSCAVGAVQRKRNVFADRGLLRRECTSLLVFRLQEQRQKRIIYAAFVASVLASVAWLISMCTGDWVELILPEHGVYLPSLDDDARGRTVLVDKIRTGLWNFCRVEYSNSTVGAASVTSSTETEQRLDEVKGIYV